MLAVRPKSGIEWLKSMKLKLLGRTISAVVMLTVALGSYALLRADECTSGMWAACDSACQDLNSQLGAQGCSATPTGYGYSIDCTCGYPVLN